jgi:hypothetical protein
VGAPRHVPTVQSSSDSKAAIFSHKKELYARPVVLGWVNVLIKW